jgi:hypothetical protein
VMRPQMQGLREQVMGFEPPATRGRCSPARGQTPPVLGPPSGTPSAEEASRT